MPIKDSLAEIGEKIGFSIGALISFLIIFAIGLVALWVTAEPYH